MRFRSIRDGTLVGRFLTIKQESTVEECKNRFNKLLVPVAFLQTVVLEETFMNGLSLWLKSEVEALESVGLVQMMKLALKIEIWEMVQRECGLSSAYESKLAHKATNTCSANVVSASDSTVTNGWQVRVIPPGRSHQTTNGR